MTHERRHWYVAGQVQGVSFRYFTHAQAEFLQIAGWVRNMPDGRVEIFAEGETEAVQSLYEWSRQGPPSAKVDSLEIVKQEAIDKAAMAAFEIRR